MSYENITAIVEDKDDGGDIDEVAAHIIKLILAEEQGTAADLLFPIVREAIRNARRRKAREIETSRSPVSRDGA